ncbi:hypothetical protein FRC00_010824 [Tulasnella sp. 408]|nr:hypothetical protein FRC00_010824 [Tulasnella sp. 408]
MSTTTQPVKHHTAADLAKFEKQMKREETMDAKNLKTAQKELAHAEKAVRKSEKAVDKSVHRHEKAAKYEHKCEDRVKEAEHKLEDAIKNERGTAKDIIVRQNKAKDAHAALAERKVDLQRVEQQQEINAARRDERLATFSAPTSTTTATGPSAA